MKDLISAGDQYSGNKTFRKESFDTFILLLDKKLILVEAIHSLKQKDYRIICLA